MTDKPEKFVRRSTLDPAVADILNGMEQRQAESQMPRKQREKLAKERKRAKERAPSRLNVDLPPRIKSLIKALAARERVPESQLVALACARLLSDIDEGRVKLIDHKRPTKSPKYDWVLEIDPDDE